MNITVYGAASSLIKNEYKEAGIQLGNKMAQRGHNLVFGGGANGMMGSVAQGVDEEGGNILAIVPQFFKEVNAEVSYKNCTEYIYTETVGERKNYLEDKGDAFIVTPGGIGTFDEFFGVLTLKQLGRHNKAIAMYNICGFYDELEKMMTKYIDEKFITEDCKELYQVFYDADKMLDYIENYDPTDIDLSKVKIR